jgi:hypothetical protein
MTVASDATAVRSRRVDTIVSITALIGVVAFLLWVSVAVAARGLGHADDSVLALAAKSLASGQGYGIPESDQGFSPYHPGISTGPPLILPAALLISLFGPLDALPGITGLAIFLGQLALTGTVLARRFGWAGTCAFLFSFILLLMIATAGYPLVGTFLGEPPTAGFIILGAAVLTTLTGPRAIVAGALCLSLAFLTKQIGLFAGAGVVGAWIAINIYDHLGARQVLRRFALLVAVGAVLPVAFETVKLVTSGVDGYVALTKQTVAFAASQVATPMDTATRVSTFIGVLQQRYLPALVLAALLAASLILLLLVRRHGQRLGSVGRFTALLWAGAAAHMAYYVAISPVWERYAWVGVALVCAAVSTPMLGIPARLRVSLVSACVAGTLFFGWYQPLVDLQRVDSIFITDHAERVAVAQMLDDNPELPFAAQAWHSIDDVLYLKTTPGIWAVEPGVSELRPRAFVALINRAFTDTTSVFYRTVTSACMLMKDGQRLATYRCEDEFWKDYPCLSPNLTPTPIALAPVAVLDALTNPAGYVPGPNATLSAAADVPAGHGYSGTSVKVSISGLPGGAASASDRDVAWDMSAYGDAATFKVWVKMSTLVNLGAVYVIISSSNGWAAYGFPSMTAGVWQEMDIAKGSPLSSNNIDWHDVRKISLRADATPSGTFTGDVFFRDLRIESR